MATGGLNQRRGCKKPARGSGGKTVRYPQQGLGRAIKALDKLQMHLLKTIEVSQSTCSSNFQKQCVKKRKFRSVVQHKIQFATKMSTGTVIERPFNKLRQNMGLTPKIWKWSCSHFAFNINSIHRGSFLL